MEKADEEALEALKDAGVTVSELTPEDFKAGGQSRSYIDLLNGHPDEYAAEIYEGMRSQAAVDAAKLSSETGRMITIKELYEMNGLEAPEDLK